MLNKFLLIVFISIISLASNAGSYNGEGSVIDLVKYYGEEYSRELKKSSTFGLSKRGLLIRGLAITILENPINIEAQTDFLNIHPSDYLEFTELFQSYKGVERTSLVDNSGIYVDIFNRLSLKYPEKGALIYAGISKDACFSADLLNYFRGGLEDFIRHHKNYFEIEKTKLSTAEKNNINDFLKAELYGKVGICKDRI
jgi:hypothetical protein